MEDPKTMNPPEPPPKTLMEAILRVQQEMPKLQKSAINPHFKSKYVPLDKLMEAVTPVLVKHGLIWLTFPEATENGGPVLRYELAHVSAPSTAPMTYQGPYQGGNTGVIGGRMPLMLDKQNPQDQGSAITYARRYALMAVLGLVADEDDDGNRAARSRTPPRPQTLVRPVDQHDLDQAARLMTPEELEILGKAVGESGQKLSLLLASVGAEDLDALTVAQGRDVMRKISGSRK